MRRRVRRTQDRVSLGPRPDVGLGPWGWVIAETKRAKAQNLQTSIGVHMLGIHHDERFGD